MMRVHILKRTMNLFREDSLFRNATFLIMSTGIMSALGFGFWLFVARFYPPSQVGIASALIAVTTLISGLSLFGLDSGLIRFLPKSQSQSSDTNAAILVVSGLTATATIIYIILNDTILNHVSTLLGGVGGAVLFILIMIAVSLNSLTDSVFIANRRAEYHTIVYATFGMVKLLLPLALITLGWLGIFSAYAVAIAVAVLVSFYFMIRICDYRFSARPNWGFITQSRKYSLNNYIGSIISGIPAQILPLIIIQRLGASSAAYFAMAWTMANLLYVAPSSITESLLAESAHHPEKKNQYIRHASKILALILVPAVAIAVFAAPYILRIFGSEYATGSTAIFQFLAISAFFVAISSVCNTVLNIEHRTSGIIFSRIATLLVTIATVFPLMQFGLAGIGFSMLLGYAASNLVYLFIFKSKKGSKARKHPVEITFIKGQAAIKGL